MSRTISTDVLRDYAEMLAREGHSFNVDGANFVQVTFWELRKEDIVSVRTFK